MLVGLRGMRSLIRLGIVLVFSLVDLLVFFFWGSVFFVGFKIFNFEFKVLEMSSKNVVRGWLWGGVRVYCYYFFWFLELLFWLDGE